MGTLPTAEPHMRVYSDRVSLVAADGSEVVFGRGPMSPAAKTRHAAIITALRGGVVYPLHCISPKLTEVVLGGGR